MSDENKTSTDEKPNCEMCGEESDLLYIGEDESVVCENCIRERYPHTETVH